MDFPSIFEDFLIKSEKNPIFFRDDLKKIRQMEIFEKNPFQMEKTLFLSTTDGMPNFRSSFAKTKF